MRNKKFNSKYAAEISDSVPENAVQGLESASIFVPPKEFLGESDLGGKINRPLFTQLETVRTTPLNRPRIRNRRPDRNMPEEDRDEIVTVSPELSEAGMKAFETRTNGPRRTNTRARRKMQEYDRNARHTFRAFVSLTNRVLRAAYPCPTCGGQKNGGNAIVPAWKWREQKYCPGCLNKGYRITSPCPSCQGTGCSQCNDQGIVRTSVKNHIFNLKKYAEAKNAAAEFHRKNCSHLVCDTECPINRTLVDCTKCIDGQIDGKTCKRCRGKGNLGVVDELRASHNENEAAKQEESRGGYIPEPLAKKHTHAVAGASRKVVDAVGKLAISGDCEEPAPQFQMSHVEGPPRVGDIVWMGNYSIANKDAGMRAGERQEPYDTYSYDPDYGNPGHHIKSRMRQEVMRGISQSDTVPDIVSVPPQDNAYQDPVSVGIIGRVSSDNRKADIMQAGRPLEAMREEKRNRDTFGYKDEKKVVYGPNEAFDTSRVPGVDFEDTAYRNDVKTPRTKKQSVVEHLRNAFNTYVRPLLPSELSPLNGPNGRVMVGKTARDYPLEKTVKVDESVLPMLSVAGHTVENHKGEKINVRHVIDLGVGVNSYRDVTRRTIDPQARQDREALGRELNRRAGIPDDHPLSLVDVVRGGEVINEPEEAKSIHGLEKTPVPIESESEAVLSLPKPTFTLPMPAPEVPGTMRHQTERGRARLLDTAEKTIGRTMSPEEVKKFHEAVDQSNGEISEGLKAIGENNGESENEIQ